MKICSSCKYYSPIITDTYFKLENLFKSKKESDLEEYCYRPQKNQTPLISEFDLNNKKDKKCYNERYPSLLSKIFKEDVCGTEGKYFEELNHDNSLN
jgi:hypothetical protein